jgi:hypothetical protein
VAVSMCGLNNLTWTSLLQDYPTASTLFENLHSRRNLILQCADLVLYGGDISLSFLDGVESIVHFLHPL